MDNKAANKRDRWIKGAVKLDCSQAQWNPLHALMHSCASRMREYGGNENTHRNHCGYIRLVYTRILLLLLLSPSILSLSISLYISLCMSQRIGTRACSLRPGARTSLRVESIIHRLPVAYVPNLVPPSRRTIVEIVILVWEGRWTHQGRLGPGKLRD